MFKALWYLFKLGLFIGFAAWLAIQPGVVVLNWGAYDISMPTGTLAVIVLVLITTGIVFSKILSGFLKIPERLQRWRKKSLQTNGYNALSKGFAALAAGDALAAKKAARTAEKSLGRQDGVIALLDALAARLAGDEKVAEDKFKLLMADKATSFLGVKGLMLMAQEQDNKHDKLTLARVSAQMHPKQAWVIRNLYGAEIEAGDWRAAEDTLNKAVRARVFTQKQAISDRIALRLALSQQKQDEGDTSAAKKFTQEAYKLNPHFVPSVLRYCDFSTDRKAAKAIEKAWGHAPHPQLLERWKALEPAARAKSTKWYDRLIQLNPLDGMAHTAAGEKAISLGMYGLARSYLREAEKHGGSKYLYQTYAKLEEKDTGNKEIAGAWLEKIETLEEEKVWICSQEGITYGEWYPISQPHGAFNSIVWEKRSLIRTQLRNSAHKQQNILLPSSKTA